MIEDFKKIKEYCSNLDNYNIYDYCFFIGITNVNEDIPINDLEILIEICSKVHGDYTDPIELGQSLANEIYKEKSINIEQLKSLSEDDLIAWYNDGREIENPLEIDDMEEREVD